MVTSSNRNNFGLGARRVGPYFLFNYTLLQLVWEAKYHTSTNDCHFLLHMSCSAGWCEYRCLSTNHNSFKVNWLAPYLEVLELELITLITISTQQLDRTRTCARKTQAGVYHHNTILLLFILSNSLLLLSLVPPVEGLSFFPGIANNLVTVA